MEMLCKLKRNPKKFKTTFQNKKRIPQNPRQNQNITKKVKNQRTNSNNTKPPNTNKHKTKKEERI
jgi:hypothetical protein